MLLYKFTTSDCFNVQANRTVLLYVARCQNEEVRRELFDESIMSGADKFAKDSVC